MRKLRITAALAVTSSLALAACGGGISTPSAGKSVDSSPTIQAEAASNTDATVLKFSTQHTESTPFSRAVVRWGDILSERTEGRVKIEMYYSGSLLPAADVLTGIMDGRAATGFVVDTMFADSLPLTVSSSIPFDRHNGMAGALAYQEMYETNEDFRAEYEKLGIHVLMFQPSGATLIGSREPVETIDDLKGKSVRCIGYTCDALTAVDANPVAIASNEIYEAMDRKTIEAWSSYPFMDIIATQFQEVTPYMTDPGIGTYIQPFTPINLDIWNSIQEEDRKVISDSIPEYFDMMAEEMNGLEVDNCAATSEAGVGLGKFNETEMKKWRDQVHDDILAKWSAEAKGATEDPEAFYDELMKSYEKHLAATDFEPLYEECLNGNL